MSNVCDEFMLQLRVVDVVVSVDSTQLLSAAATGQMSGQCGGDSIWDTDDVLDTETEELSESVNAVLLDNTKCPIGSSNVAWPSIIVMMST